MPACQTPIIVALDFPSSDAALALADRLDPALCRVKVGKELFTRSGPQVVEGLHGASFSQPLSRLREYVTIVRKDRNSDGWYVGSVTDGNKRTLDLKLDFLDPGKTYLAEIYRDGDNADYRDDKRRFDIAIEKRNVTSADTIKMVLAPGGGQAIRLVPLK